MYRSSCRAACRVGTGGVSERDGNARLGWQRAPVAASGRLCGPALTHRSALQPYMANSPYSNAFFGAAAAGTCWPCGRPADSGRSAAPGAHLALSAATDGRAPHPPSSARRPSAATRRNSSVGTRLVPLRPVCRRRLPVPPIGRAGSRSVPLRWRRRVIVIGRLSATDGRCRPWTLWGFLRSNASLFPKPLF